MSTNARRRQRPRRVIAITLVVFAIGVVRAVQAVRVWQSADQYAALEVSFPPLLDVALSAAWGAAFLIVSAGLWALRNWARRAVLILLPAYAVFSIVWLAIFTRSDYDSGRLPFLAFASALAVWLILWTLTRRSVRAAFSPPADGGLDDGR
ncbi:MAG: hypothetical protein M5R40_16840 [Anaerolineae bacterium]|nr:hypothetical protein [Anaerolineae bacterium]